MAISITTRYENFPGSNVGKYVARSLGRQATVRTDQALSSEDNHRRAAQRLAMKLAELGVISKPDVLRIRVIRVEDDGRRVWEAGQ